MSMSSVNFEIVGSLWQLDLSNSSVQTSEQLSKYSIGSYVQQIMLEVSILI